MVKNNLKIKEKKENKKWFSKNKLKTFVYVIAKKFMLMMDKC